MSIRTTMANAVDAIRELIGDNETKLTDAQLLREADANTLGLGLWPLVPVEAIAGGLVVYTTWVDPDGAAWEEDTALLDASYASLSPSTADYLNGHFTFAEGQAAVYAQGRRFDLYGAAADALVPLMALYAKEYDFATKGKQFARSQTFAALTALQAQYSAKRIGLLVGMGTTDVIA